MTARLLRLLPLLALLALAPAGAPLAQEPAPRVVMNLAAHPDDEDALTMAYYRYAENAVVHSVIYTRGEGGQNEIGPELYEWLGAIRTAETEAAARHLGTQVHFLNFDDFGFSKTAAETFERWGGREAVTARLVYLIRRYKPDVLFTNHDTLTVGPRRQHGHHQAVGISAVRAMNLAADRTYRPEQLREEGVDLWQPQRLFLRLWRGGQDTAHVRVPVGDLLPGRDVSAADLAVRAVAEHRSQGFDTFAERFRQPTTYFVLLKSAPGAPPLPAGATSLAAGLPPNPHASRATLAHRIDSGRQPGFPAGALSVSQPVAVPGQMVTLTWPAGDGARLALTGAVDTTLTASPARIRIPAGATPTLPKERAQYRRYENHPPVQAALVDASGAIRHAEHLDLEIAPPVWARPLEAVPMQRGEPHRVLLRPGAENRFTISGEVHDPGVDSVMVRMVVRTEVAGASRVRADRSVTVPISGTSFEAVLDVPAPDGLPAGAHPVVMLASFGPTELHPRGMQYALGLDGHVVPAVALPEGLRVGFVSSYDGTTRAALEEMGVDVTLLDEDALASGDFHGLHTIVVDIRGYLVRPDLRAHNDRLLEWVRRGGHLVVTYQKTFEWNEDHPDPFVDDVTNPAGFAPLALRLGRDRVTRHDAPVTFLHPEHPLVTTPNPLTDADWDGWVQERGLYFPASYDDAFVELFAMADPGEAPLRSSTLLAPYGEGTYLYTALGWYRQLGAFVPGAYRAFANLISLPLTDGRAGR